MLNTTELITSPYLHQFTAKQQQFTGFTNNALLNDFSFIKIICYSICKSSSLSVKIITDVNLLL